MCKRRPPPGDRLFDLQFGNPGRDALHFIEDPAVEGGADHMEQGHRQQEQQGQQPEHQAFSMKFSGHYRQPEQQQEPEQEREQEQEREWSPADDGTPPYGAEGLPG